jgi:cell division septum initiation protein DivIVA
MDEYNALLEKNEELEDIILYLKAKLESGNEQTIPLREAIFLRKQNQTV